MPSPEFIQPVTKADVLGLATWSRERSSEELQDLISRRSDMHEDLDEFEAEL